MRILAVTTATPHFAVALLDGEEVRTRSYDGEKAHAERMFAEIDAVMAGIARESLDAVGCDVGPGSFTGIRVGLAAAKGIALGLGIPLVPVGSLESMATVARERAPEAEIVAVLDARRGEIFVQRFTLASSDEARHLPRTAVADLVAAHPAAVFCGMPLGLGERRVDVEHPDAAAIARLARDRLEDAPPLDAIEPTYLRPPDAKLPQR